MGMQFSFFLSRFLEESSHLLFGEADLARYSKESAFQYSNNWHGSRSRTWLVSMASIGWSGTDVFVKDTTNSPGGIPALVDSGTSLIVLSAGIYDALVEELSWRIGPCKYDKEEELLECQCPPLNDLSKLPWLEMSFIDESWEHFTLSMSPDEYILEALDPHDSTKRLCIPSLTRGEKTLQRPIILGMTFMRSFYTVFDVKNMRVGFARSNESPLPSGIELQFQLRLKRVIWIAAAVVTLMSLMLACYVLFDPDPRGLKVSFAEGDTRTIAVCGG